MVALHLVLLVLLRLILLLRHQHRKGQNLSVVHLPEAVGHLLFVAIPPLSPIIHVVPVHGHLILNRKETVIRAGARHTLVNKRSQGFPRIPVELVSAANIRRPLWQRPLLLRLSHRQEPELMM